MSRLRAACALGALAFLFVTVHLGTAQAQKTMAGTDFVIDSVHQEDVLKLGHQAYNRYCVGCHGEKGDGKGPAARWLFPKPRDFTTAVFKFRTTPSGALPTDEDLVRTITEGVHGTSMPNWRLVPELERKAMAQYIKTFSTVWGEKARRAPPLNIPHPPANLKSADFVKMGRTVYRTVRCDLCHGKTGGGDGSSSGAMKDDWGEPIAVANFQRGVLRGGRTPQDLYRAIATGFSGTPMPGFSESLKPERIWQMVSYIRHLIKNEGDPTPDDLLDQCVVWDNCEEATAEAQSPTAQGTTPSEENK